MPAVTNDLFKVTLSGEYFNQRWNNVFWYYNTTGVGNLNLQNVADDFDAELMVAMAGAQVVDVTYTNIRVSHVNGTLADVNITPSQGDGDVIGTPMSPFVCVAIRLNRTTKETRNGWKRLIGVTEENTGAQFFTPAYQLLVDAVGTAIMQQLSMGSATNNLDPVIVRQTGPASWIYNRIASTQTIAQPTTQNSRKIGRGV